jgi:hypothetical protein
MGWTELNKQVERTPPCPPLAKGREKAVAVGNFLSREAKEY